MRKRYGIELKFINEKTLQEIKKWPISDYTDTIIILPSKRDFEQLKEVLIDKNLYENSYVLFELNTPTLTNLSNDYGFQSSQNTFYLFLDLVSAFTIIDGDKTSKEMFVLQLDEYIVAKSNNIYFVDSQFNELVQKIATAYGVKITYSTSTK